MERLLDAALGEGRPVRCLVEIGPEFAGLTPAAAWEDVKLGLRALHAFAGCAVVTDVAWVGGLTRFASFLLPYPVRTFAARERDAAVERLVSLPAGPGVSHRLVEESGIVVEVSGPLRVADFEALTRIVDPWIEAEGSLRGLVLHARDVPGWENIAAEAAGIDRETVESVIATATSMPTPPSTRSSGSWWERAAREAAGLPRKL